MRRIFCNLIVLISLVPFLEREFKLFFFFFTFLAPCECEFLVRITSFPVPWGLFSVLFCAIGLDRTVLTEMVSS